MEPQRNLAESYGKAEYGRSAGESVRSARPPSISLTDLLAEATQTSTSGSLKATPIVDNFLSMIPMGHEKALKYAFYNVLAMVLSGFLLFMLWGAYCVLNPFLKSLLWAVLVGSVLYPFKKNISGASRNWLENVKNSSTPFVVHIVTSPIVVADNISNIIGNYVVQFWKSTLSALAVFFLTYIVYYNPPTTLVTMGQVVGTFVWNILLWSFKWIINLPVVIALNVVYVGHVVSSVKKSPGQSSESGSQVEPERVNSPATDHADGNENVATPTTTTPSTNSSSSSQKEDQQHKRLGQILPYLTLIITFIYICLNILPYSLLIALVLFITLGIITYVQGKHESSTDVEETAQILPSLSRYARMVVLNIGAGTPLNSGGYGRGSFYSPRGTGPTTTEERRTRLQKSWSEGSAVGFSSRSASKEPTEGSIQEGADADASHEESPHGSSPSHDGIDGSGHDTVLLDSNKFLYGVFCACVVVQVWNRPWLMHLLPLPVVYYGLKKLCVRFGISDYVDVRIRTPIKELLNKATSSESAEVEVNQVLPIRLIFRILSAADRRLVSICEDILDPVSSILVFVLVGMATVVGLIFIATNVYAEGDHLVRVSVQLVNSTVSQYPEINAMLPDGWQSIMSSMVGNAHQYGKETITNMIRDSISEKNADKAEQIERQLIELWDKIYETWNSTWENAFPDQIKHQGGGISGAKSVSWDELLETGKEMPRLLELSVLTNYAKANVGTLYSILESVWNILIGNVSLVISSVTSVVSVLFGGGTAILNLIINLVIFSTALFYLLSSSTDVYKPVELFNLFSPSGGVGSGDRTTGFAKAVEEAVNSVFAASFKMAAFYGMWTWLIHTLFQVNIVFLPSIAGCLFGAVPILAPYFAALPAILELWLIQGHWPKALCMFLAQMAPMSMVDTQIYSEIKGGGHPYLTGLAIAGGIFYFGIQGAIMGPVILCCVFVAIKVGHSFIRDEVGAGAPVSPQQVAAT